MLPQNRMIEDLKKSRIFLIPGHKSELFCLVAEEARELCIPIVTMGIGSLSERVEHGITGFIANSKEEFANYTLDLYKNQILWSELRKNLIKIRGKNNWRKVSEKLLNLY